MKNYAKMKCAILSSFFASAYNRSNDLFTQLVHIDRLTQFIL